MDGWGIGKKNKYNAVYMAKTPNHDSYERKCPFAKLSASGKDVGLPRGQFGNSEVGHITIGAGRVVKQHYLRINDSIKDKSFFENKALVKAMKNHRVHLIGLVSDGGVHSHIKHLFALIKMAKKYKPELFVHAFLDGRDTPPRCAAKYLKKLKRKLKDVGEIATLSGRYYAMDRDNRWGRIKKAYDVITKAEGVYYDNPLKALEHAYSKGENDEFVTPVITSENYHGVKDGDSVIFFNFREDRARQLTRAFVDEKFSHFKRQKLDVKFTCMTMYDEKIKNVDIAYDTVYPENTLGEVVSRQGLNQLRIAETEKYAHVTYFFSGLREKPFPGEDRILLHSPKVATYDKKPEMSAYKILEKVVDAIKSEKYPLIILNFANGDMVGHTGIMKAAIKAAETVDKCVGKIVELMLEKDGYCLITADHGNLDQMAFGKGKISTEHSTNPVPFILVSNEEHKIKPKGTIANIAPTILELMGIRRPEEMVGSLVI